MRFVIEKIEKAIKNLERALNDVRNDKIRNAISHLDYCKENAQEAIYLILAEIETKEFKSENKSN